MKKVLPWLIYLYVVALHTSMAGMEIFGWLLVAAGFGLAISNSEWKLVRENLSLIGWLGVMVFAVLGSLLSTPQYKPFWFQFGYLRWILVLWGLTLALQWVWNPQFERRLVRVWMVMLALAGAYGLFQSLTGVDFLREGKIYSQGDNIYKAVGFFSFSLTYAYSVGLSTLALSIPALTLERTRWGWLVCVMGALGILSSMSRGAWLAAIICVFIYMWVNKRKMFVPVFALGVLVMVAVGLSSHVMGEKFIRLLTFQHDDSANLRFNIWRGYAQMFLDHPLFGVGLLDGDKILPAYFARLNIDQEFVSHAHSNYLQWLAGAGILGFISYISIIYIFLRKAWRLTSSVPHWGWSLLLAQIFLHLGGLTEANFINTAVNHFLMFTWALILVLESRRPNSLA